MTDKKITKRMRAYRAFGEVFSYLFILYLYNTNPNPVVFNGVVIVLAIFAVIGLIRNIGRES